MYPNRIRELRIEKGITQIRLSIELEVTQETISPYERGKNLPTVTNLMRLSKPFNVSMDYIMMQSDHRYTIDNGSIKPDEKRLLAYFRLLGPVQKEKSLSYLQGLCDTDNPH